MGKLTPTLAIFHPYHPPILASFYPLLPPQPRIILTPLSLPLPLRVFNTQIYRYSYTILTPPPKKSPTLPPPNSCIEKPPLTQNAAKVLRRIGWELPWSHPYFCIIFWAKFNTSRNHQPKQIRKSSVCLNSTLGTKVFICQNLVRSFNITLRSSPGISIMFCLDGCFIE